MLVLLLLQVELKVWVEMCSGCAVGFLVAGVGGASGVNLQKFSKF